MVARNDRELFGADYAANAVFEIGNSKMSIGITNTLEHYFRTIKFKVVMDQDQFIIINAFCVCFKKHLSQCISINIYC